MCTSCYPQKLCNYNSDACNFQRSSPLTMPQSQQVETSMHVHSTQTLFQLLGVILALIMIITYFE